jgi:4-diphosphocytidyl-2-C-methyl-D-erythritol kinase
VHLEIEKNVPIAGGMGGGSADAAATLVACDAMWGTALSKEELHALAVKLGADVPFALSGGTAIGTGRGDRLSPALATGSFHWVLALAEFGLSTPGVYGELDRRRGEAPRLDAIDSRPVVDAAVLHALRAGDARRLAGALHNDLQSAALGLAPGLGGILELGEAHGAMAGIVSGSGPTVAFLADDADTALELQIALSAARLNAVHVHGPVHGARIMYS